MSAGKGSRPRNNHSQKFRDNYDAIFSRKEKSKSSTHRIGHVYKIKKSRHDDCPDCHGKGYWTDAMGTHLFDCDCTK